MSAAAGGDADMTACPFRLGTLPDTAPHRGAVSFPLVQSPTRAIGARSRLGKSYFALGSTLGGWFGRSIGLPLLMSAPRLGSVCVACTKARICH